MAIQPPRSGVQLLSPAALLGNNQRPGSSFDQAMTQAMNLFGQQQLQASSQAFQAVERQKDRTATDARTLANLLASGEAERVEDVTVLPGEANFNTFDFGGETLVSGTDIAQRALGRELATKVSAIGGQDLIADVTIGDLVGGATNFGSEGPTQTAASNVSAGRNDAFLAGDDKGTIAELEALQQILSGRPQEFSGLSEAISQGIADINADAEAGGFSRAEANEVRERFGLEDARAWAESVHGLNEVDREASAAVGQSAVDYRVKKQVQSFDSITGTNLRDLTMEEAQAFGKLEQGFVLTDREQEIVDTLTLRERVTVMDRQAQIIADSSMAMSDVSTNAALTSRAILGMRDVDGEFDVTNLLFQKILDDTKETTVTHASVSKWLQSPLSKAYRDSWAISQNIGSTVSSINTYRLGGGLIPTNVKAAVETPGSYIHDDDPLVGFNIRPTGAPLSAVDEEAFDAEMTTFRENLLTSAPAGSSDFLDKALQSGDYNTVIANLREGAEHYEKLSQSDVQNEAQQAQNAEYAAVLRDLMSLSQPYLSLFQREFSRPSGSQ